jgi:hypothetical protein
MKNFINIVKNGMDYVYYERWALHLKFPFCPILGADVEFRCNFSGFNKIRAFFLINYFFPVPFLFSPTSSVKTLD